MAMQCRMVVSFGLQLLLGGFPYGGWSSRIPALTRAVMLSDLELFLNFDFGSVTSERLAFPILGFLLSGCSCADLVELDRLFRSSMVVW